MQTLQQQLKDACEDSGEVDFRNSYSGRGMYGRQCVGIVGTFSECMSIVGAVIKNMKSECSTGHLDFIDEATAKEIEEAENLFDEHVDTLLDFCQDSMGMGGVIIYWPELSSIEEVEAESDGQSSESQEWHDFDPDC